MEGVYSEDNASWEGDIIPLDDADQQLIRYFDQNAELNSFANHHSALLCNETVTDLEVRDGVQLPMEQISILQFNLKQLIGLFTNPRNLDDSIVGSECIQRLLTTLLGSGDYNPADLPVALRTYVRHVMHLVIPKLSDGTRIWALTPRQVDRFNMVYGSLFFHDYSDTPTIHGVPY